MKELRKTTWAMVLVAVMCMSGAFLSCDSSDASDSGDVEKMTDVEGSGNANVTDATGNSGYVTIVVEYNKDYLKTDGAGDCVDRAKAVLDTQYGTLYEAQTAFWSLFQTNGAFHYSLGDNNDARYKVISSLEYVVHGTITIGGSDNTVDLGNNLNEYGYFINDIRVVGADGDAKIDGNAGISAKVSGGYDVRFVESGSLTISGLEFTSYSGDTGICAWGTPLSKDSTNTADATLTIENCTFHNRLYTYTNDRDDGNKVRNIINNTFINNNTVGYAFFIQGQASELNFCGNIVDGYTRGINIHEEAPTEAEGSINPELNRLNANIIDNAFMNNSESTKCCIQLTNGKNALIERNAFMNVVGNTIKFHEAGSFPGTVTIRYNAIDAEYTIFVEGTPPGDVRSHGNILDIEHPGQGINDSTEQPSLSGYDIRGYILKAGDRAWYDKDPSAKTFTILGPNEMMYLAALVNSGVSFEGRTVTLGADIDFEGYDILPIGTERSPFMGTFDGDYYTISNISITDLGEYDADQYLGLFGVVSGAPNGRYTDASDIFHDGVFQDGPVSEGSYTTVIKNIVLKNIEIVSNGSKVGALIGEANDALVSSVTVENGTISGTNSIGGIVGRGYGTVIRDCATGEGLSVGNGDNTAGSIYNFGGIAGSLRASDSDTPALSAVIDTVNRASVSTYLSAGGAAGIVGQVPGKYPLVVYGCDNHGDITIEGNPVIKSAYSAVAGGIGGMYQGTVDSVIAECDNYGKISSTSVNASGSLSGIANYYSGLIYRCANHGEVSGNAYYSAGMVGHGSTIVIDECENDGEISVSFEKGYTSTICAGTTTVTYRNMVFDDVGSLTESLVKSTKTANELTDTSASMYFENVSVIDNGGELVLPEYLCKLVADTQICINILIGDRDVFVPSPHQINIQVEVGVPGATVTLNGSMAVGSGSADNHSQLILSAENMTLINNGHVDMVYITDDGATIRNNGAIKAVSDYKYVKIDSAESISGASGTASVTVYNGSDTDKDATMESVELRFMNGIVYNYGTMESSGYLLTIGCSYNGGSGTSIPVKQNNSFTLYNYGDFIGNRVSDNNQKYMIYAPAAKELNFYNYEGSRFVNNSCTVSNPGLWFIYYGDDGVGDTDEGGDFNFFYAESTVLTKSTDGSSELSSIDPTPERIAGDRAKCSFTKIDNTQSLVTVTINDGLGSTSESTIVSGTAFSPQTPFAMGLEFKGWICKGAAWTPGSAVDEDAVITATWSPSGPSVSITGPSSAESGKTITLSSNISNESLHLGYSYEWSIGEKVIGTGKSVSFTGDSDCVVTLKVSAESDNNASISGTASTQVEKSCVFTEPPLIDPDGGIDITTSVEGGSFEVTDVPIRTDVSLDLTFPEVSGISIDIKGVSVNTRMSVDLSEIGDRHGKGMDLGFDISLEGFSRSDIDMRISIPVNVPAGHYISDVEAFFWDDISSRMVSVPGVYASERSVVITTDHNTEYYLSIEYSQTYVPDDDDELPFIPSQSDDGADTTTIIAAIAATAVVALLAIIIVSMERRR